MYSDEWEVRFAIFLIVFLYTRVSKGCLIGILSAWAIPNPIHQSPRENFSSSRRLRKVLAARYTSNANDFLYLGSVMDF